MSNATIRLLERVRSRTEPGSDYAVAQALEISRFRMSNYMRGVNELEDDAVLYRAAEILGDDPAALVAAFHAETTKDQRLKAMWRSIEKTMRLGATPAAAALLAMGATMTPPPSHATQAESGNLPGQPAGSMYIMLSLLRRLLEQHRSGWQTLRRSAIDHPNNRNQLPLFPTIPDPRLYAQSGTYLH